MTNNEILNKNKTNNSITAKLTYTANDIGQSLLDLDKSLCVSRTKAEMREYIESAKEKLIVGEKRLDAPRNNLEPFDINREDNTVYEDMQAILNKLGDMQYDLMQNDTRSASKHLYEVIAKIRGY